MNQVRFGIVGLGSMGLQHAKTMLELGGEVRLAAVASRNEKHIAVLRGLPGGEAFRVFDTPKDKIIFDVGHQSYTHKLITGRYSAFDTLRTYGGLAGFPRRSESEYDLFDAGHASTSISQALGMARTRDAQGQNL